MDWHRRFLQQAGWTHDLRAYLFERAGLQKARLVLEVGCGTGAILSDLAFAGELHGLDLDAARLTEAHVHAPRAALACGDALALPYCNNVFDITFCHYLLLWVHDPIQALEEMKRVTRQGGAVMAMAEPDYTRRVDGPEALIPLGCWQAEALRQQGADPGLGSRLADLFHQAGIRIMETGTLQAGMETRKGKGQHSSRLTPAERELEWLVLEADLAGQVPAEELSRLKTLDEQAWQRGERVLHVPTYFAWGRA